MNNYFKNRKLVIATMHKKETVIQPLLEKSLGVKCITLDNLNTDKFGTFTRDIKRSWDMLEAARLKVYHAMDISGCDLWISNEWSFWMHKWLPFINSDFELSLLVDRKNNLEIRWHHLSPNTNVNWKYVTSVEDAIKTAKEWWFPEYWIIVRLRENINFFIYKNINTENDLKKSVNKLLSFPFIKKVYLETDMRAFRNPTRMKNIELSIKDLVKNIQSECPNCWAPWFVVKDIKRWLPCWWCLLPTNIPISEIYFCDKCNFSKEVKIEKYWDFADPWECPNCNP